MKKGLVIVSSLSMVLVFGCASMRDALANATGLPNVSSGMGLTGSTSGSESTLSSATAVVEFKAGEVLGSADTGSKEESAYFVGKIMTPASKATKNQAEFLFVSDGSKQWVNHTINSRKATKADFVVGAKVLVLSGWAEHDSISADAYRKERWILGTVTNVDELFKNRVEVSGAYYHINYVRVEIK